MSAKISGKTASATAAKTAKKSAAAKAKKPRKAEVKAAATDGAKKKPAPKASKKSKRQSLAESATPTLRLSVREAPPSASIMGFAAPEALVMPEPRLDRGQHRDMGVVAGSDGPTARFRAGATDLCEVVPSGRVAVAGDTFTGPKARTGEWSPSLALHVRSLSGKVEFDDSFGWNDLYQDGPPPPGWSQLPAGTVRVGDVDYLMVTRTQDLRPVDSRLVVIDPDKPGWVTVPNSMRPASWENGNQTQISGCEGPDGYVYIVADDFHRQHPVVMYRCLRETFTNRDSWEGWGMVNGDPNNWGWGVKPPAPLHPNWFGELSLRFIDGKFVLSALNDTTHQIEVRVHEKANQVLNPGNPPYVPGTPCTVVVNARELPYLYGGYIVPGSTLDRMRILVSEWFDPEHQVDYPYNVREYEVNVFRND